ncbi:MAG: M28 family peptidase [Planctomycetes bacterium]|nr:M28 family peptidase [Planctomycetota bacterium]
MRAPACMPVLLALLGGCRAGPTEADALAWQKRELAKREQSETPAEKPAAEPTGLFHHAGPAVAPGGTGPARYALLVYEAFDSARALSLAEFTDRFWREPGNQGYEAVLARVREELGSLRFGEDPERTLQWIQTPMSEPAWTPLSGRLVLHSSAGEHVLHAFDAPEGRDRLMLPKNAPCADVQGRIALSLESLQPGEVLVLERHASRKLIEDARARGAVALLACTLEGFNTDKSGKQRELDAIQYQSVPAGTTLPCGQISRRSLQAIRAALGADPGAQLEFHAAAKTEQQPLHTLVATIVGSTEPDKAVALAAHVQEPGACDNASGVATQLELLRAIVAGLDSGRIERPRQSLCFVWGLEMRQSSILLEQPGRTIVAAVVGDMTGESREASGALPLLERPPDPGALEALAPDAHTEWGASPVQLKDADASAIALVARTALHDTALAAGGWETREHPFEGGSDHQVFLGKGIPAVLFWHFTDFTYHTSLDRMEMVDPEEMRRTGTAIASTALALADARPGDLDRYLRSLRLEIALRVQAAEKAQRASIATRWAQWERLERQWLRRLCLGEKAGLLPAIDAPAADAK